MKNLFLLLLLPLTFFSCAEKEKEVVQFNKSFAPYISAYTTGIISTHNKITLRLTTDVAEESWIGEEYDKPLFELQPAVPGKAVWTAQNTIEFVPEEPLAQNEFFDVYFALGNVMQVPDSLGSFHFQFRTKRQQVSFEDGMLLSSGNDLLTYKGTLLTADKAADEEVEDVLNAAYLNTEMDIDWTHTNDGLTHHFSIPNIEKQSSPAQMELTWDGRPLGAADDGSRALDIPVRGVFELGDVIVNNEGDQSITLVFSDPVDATQNLEGLVEFKSSGNFQITTESNRIIIYPAGRLSGSYELVVHRGIQNSAGEKLAKTAIEEVSMEELKPAVRLVGDGVIIPSSGELVFPFEAVNLSAVDVSIARIYENNILQFLQFNRMDGSNYLYQTADIVQREMVPLDPSKASALKKWSRYGISLDEIIEPEPGAIYHVNLSFRPEYSAYHCTNNELGESENLTHIRHEEDDNDAIRWNFYSDYNFEYDWRHRDDPCHRAYYRHHRFVNRNVLASNIGVIGKYGNDGQLQITTTDLLDARPAGKVQLKVYDFRMQELATASTGQDGMASLDLKKRPYFVVASRGTEKGYLRLAQGEGLSMSRFNTNGVSTEKGLKGMIYGEREVWRPGDSIYLTFVLRDPEGHLPANYPVNLTFTNPRGQVVSKMSQTPQAGRFYHFPLATTHDAETGNYRVSVSAGGIRVNKNIMVETIKPNRLKVDFAPGTSPITAAQEQVDFDVSSQWLHGAPASGLEYKVEMGLAHRNTTFDDYPGYEFDDKAYPFHAEPQVIGEGLLDEDGKAAFSANLLPNQRAPGKLKATFKTRVYERSGNFSVAPYSTDFYPYPAFVGIKAPEGNRWTGVLPSDSAHDISVVVVDHDGKPLRNKEVTVRLYRLSWRWWWQSTDENIATYVRNNYAKPLQEAEVETNAKGEATWSMQVDDQRWGRYLIWAEDEKGGHRAGEIVRLDNRRYARSSDGSDGAAMLPLSMDKEKYSVGETATITFPAGTGGRALVSLESGTSVLRSFWVKTEEGQNTIDVEIETTAEMVPNVYANIMLVQPHAQTQNDLPIRMYGVVPIMVENPETHLEPVISSAESIRPNTTASVEVSEAQGREMTYTLAVVDEGLLGITGFSTPNPWDHFFAKEALGVQTWDVFDNVLGAFGGQMEQLLSIGGGEAEIDASAEKDRANRFKPMVRYLGPFTLEKGASNTHEVDIPQYVGAVRMMVVAGNETAYGKAERTVEVKKPLMVLSTVPRVLGPGETARIPVEVFAMADNVKNATVDLSTNELFEIKGSSRQQVTFDRPGSKLVFFEVEVNEQVGVGKLSINASSSNETAVDEVELNVRHPNAALTNYVTAEIGGRGEANFDYKPIGIKGTNEAMLELSVLPPMNMGGRLEFLIRYPYGCVEQTTSAIFPQLFVNDVIKLEEHKVDEIESNIEVAIRKLNRFQHPNGGMRYWPGSSGSDDWSSSYVGHFMVEAKRKGYRVPYGFLEKWTNYQTSQANNWEPVQSGTDGWNKRLGEYMQAYRLFTLALNDKPAMGAMNRMKQISGLSDGARWRLAAAYAMAGQKEVAADLIRPLDFEFEDYHDYSYTYGSALRDEAMALETLVILDEQDKAQELMENVTKALAHDRWLGTQTTAYCLIAVSKYAARSGKGLAFDYKVSDGPDGQVEQALPMWQQAVPAPYDQTETISLTNNMDVPLYARVVLTGKPPVGQETPAFNNLDLDVTYTNMTGDPIDISTLEQGTDFLATVTVSHAGAGRNYDQMALTQIFPSGWEVINARMDDISYQMNQQDIPEYQDIRDDRVYTYFDLRYRGEQTFIIGLTATYAGRYYLPAVKAEAMYDDDINANSRGQWVHVLMPGTEQSQK